MNQPLRKLLRILLKTLLVLLVLLAAFAIYFIAAIYQPVPEIAEISAEKQEPQVISPDFKRLGNNWLRKSESGLWEMYLEGNGFERGVANGKLTKELSEFQETVFINQIKELVPSANYLNFLKYFVAYFNRKLPEHITQEYQDEIYGVSLSASDKFDRLAPKYYRILNYHSAHDIGHALQDKNMVVGCTSFGVWKNRTVDGKLLLGRNFDFFAGDDFAKNKIVCFTKPEKGYKFMYVTWAGFTGVVSGMNDQGLTVTINASKSDIPKSAATPISLLAKEILQYARSIAEAYDIAQKRQTFVSESILIGSSTDKSAAIIEKTPTRTNLYSENGEELICSNHYRSALFANDYINNKNMVESSSLYRKFRMQQLLARTQKFTPEDAAKVLRNQDGLNDQSIGLTNEKGINQLIAHHSIIFRPEERLVWVSASPYQLGKYVCYDLDEVFREAPSKAANKEINDSSKTIPADPFLFSEGYKNFLLFKKIKSYIQYCTKSPYDLKVDATFIKTFVNTNPGSYFTYWVIGDYYLKQNNTTEALRYYKEALTKEVATQKEAAAIEEHIAALEKAKPMAEKQAEHPALKELLRYVAEHSPFYRSMFEKNGINIDTIHSLEDLQKIPFTEKEDLQAHTEDFICVPKHKLVDYVTTSGTTGKPVTLALTDADLDRLALNEYNSFKTAGISGNDIIQLMTTIDRRFMAGLAYFLGARKLGAGIIRVGNGIPELQWDTIQNVRPSVIVCVPSFILQLIEFAEKHGIDFKNSSVKKAICIGEAIRNPDFTLNALGNKIVQKWDLELFSTYASSEMATAFTECSAFKGGHLQEELLIAEVIGENGLPVSKGEAGELVITTLGMEGMPLLRFKTGDICRAHTEACSCGKTSLRLSPVLGRKKQMIKYKGTSLYPNAIYDILENVPQVKNYQVEVSSSTHGTDEITIHIGIAEGVNEKDLDLSGTFRAKLRVVPQLNFLSAELVNDMLQPGNGRKAVKFVDKRSG